MPDQPQTGATGRFYYADGKRIPLAPSSHFVAVRAEPGDAARAATASLASSLARTVAPGNVFELPEHGLVVIAVDGAPGARAASPPQVEAVRSFVAAQPTMAPGPTVYEAMGSPTAEALIPTSEILVRFKPEVSAAAKQQILESYHLRLQRADYPEPGTDLVVTTQPNQDPIDAANALHESDQVESAAPNFARLMPRLSASSEDGGGTTLTLPEAPTAVEKPAREEGAPTSDFGPSAVPTDPGFASQWGLKKIRGPEAFDISMGSAAISVAVIDEGCDLAHEDLVYKLPGYDALTGTDNPSPQPADGHGTCCAGIVAMRANNGKGGAGVAPNCNILPVRIARGAGTGWYTSDAYIADGIRKAVDRGADVLSNSWGGGAPSTVITNAFQYARTNGRGGRGCPIAIATGNGDAHAVGYPANLSPTIPGLLAVGASNEWDQRKSRTSLDGENWWGSNYGPEVDVVAPGVHIYTADITGAAGYGGSNYIPNFNGTSSATPHVAGLMALILSVDPDLRSWEVEDIVKLTAQDLGTPGRDEEFGFGRIDCRRALEAASRVWYEIAIVPEFIGAGKECFMRIRLRMFNPGINSIRLDSVTLTSHNPSWTAEIDRFEYRPNPGGIMAPRVGNDLRFNGILLKANGTQASWSYRWNLSWSYTFWRPTAQVLPAAGAPPVAESEGRTVTAPAVRGGEDMSGRGVEPAPSGLGQLSSAHPSDGAQAAQGDMVTVDRRDRSITVRIAY